MPGRRATTSRRSRALVMRESDRCRGCSRSSSTSRACASRASTPVDLARRRARRRRVSRSRIPIATEASRVDVRRARATSRASIEGDEDLLHRAVFNLALNAVQASPARQRGAHRGARGLDADAGGLPFDDERRRRCASPTPARAFRPRSATGCSIRSSPRRPSGSGLGLAVVHRAIEAHAASCSSTAAPTARASPSSCRAPRASRRPRAHRQRIPSHVHRVSAADRIQPCLIVDDETGILDSLEHSPAQRRLRRRTRARRQGGARADRRAAVRTSCSPTCACPT